MMISSILSFIFYSLFDFCLFCSSKWGMSMHVRFPIDKYSPSRRRPRFRYWNLCTESDAAFFKQGTSDQLNCAVDGLKDSILLCYSSATSTSGIKMSGTFFFHLFAELFGNDSDLQKHLNFVHGHVLPKAQYSKCDRVFEESNFKAHIENVDREVVSNFIRFC